LVRLSGSAATVFVANPEIADVQVKSPTLVYISAKAPGETVIYAVDASDSVLLNVSILVEHDISRLRSSLRQLAPGEGISADSVDGNLVLSGGVSLTFTPTVIDANHLNLRVRPEVSELSTTGEVSVPIAPGQVVTIPALTVRRAEASVELGSGESFALAGLLQHTSTQTISKVPWLGDIPILGALFKSDGFQRGETDLVVIVTPYLVNPVKTRLAAPTDGLKLPTMRSGCCSATSTARACPDPGRARSMPAAMA
jgi:pilus assembly protein CpaC